jgi:tetratricopeptide (TPR) repeat protein/mono/diheme cytochrome c family protein
MAWDRAPASALGRRAVFAFALLAVGLLQLAVPGRAAIPAPRRAGPVEAPPNEAPPTFTRDVAPVFFRNCGDCHHPGGAGPFSLLSYQEAKKHAKQIASVTGRRYMPPWLPEPGHGDFLGARRLTDAQIDTIARWAQAGAPEGNPSDLPPVPSFSDGWRLGIPDLVLELPEAYTLRAGGTDFFRNFVFPVPVEARRYVKSFEILPGNPRVVHHANVLVDRFGAARQLDREDADLGFGGMKVKLESRRFEPQTHFLFWKPGTPPVQDPESLSWPVDKGNDLVLNMHLKPSGKQEAVKPSLGLYFGDTAPTKFPILMQLEHDGALDIPAGRTDFTVTDELTMPLDVELLAIYPHAHYLGKEVQASATLPTGEKKPLIWIKDWNLDWQAVYRYAVPVSLPRGTVVSMRWTYDNSAANVRNPNHPPRRVRAGNLSTDEMSHLWIQVLPARQDDRKVLQESLMRQKLRKYPRDFEAHFGLASVLQSMGKVQEALEVYRKALAIKPGDPTAENNVGAAILSTGPMNSESLAEATQHFRASLKGRPDYVDALHNLGKALLAQGNAEEAASQFTHVLYVDPDDVDAHAYLGSANVMQGKLPEAAKEFQAALRLDPGRESAYYGLGYVEARLGDLDGAVAHLERAVAIRPEDASAHTELGIVYGARGNLDRAIEHLDRAVRLDPGNRKARAALDQARAQQGGAR